MKRIVIIGEDEELFALRHILVQEGYHVRRMQFQGALSKLRDFRPQLVIVESSPPRVDVSEIKELMRKTGSLARVPILVLTAKHETPEQVRKAALVDGYLGRPLQPNAVLAAVKMLVHTRSTHQPSVKIVVDELMIDPLCHRVERAGELIVLSALEFRLLYYLASHPNMVCRRDQLLNEVWDIPGTTARAIDVCIRHLRKKIERSPEKPRCILSVRAKGYTFCTEAQPDA